MNSKNAPQSQGGQEVLRQLLAAGALRGNDILCAIKMRARMRLCLGIARVSAMVSERVLRLGGKAIL